jgi:hypothetical protein
MTAPDHLVISGPEDILGFIPHSLGYWPESSLVAITMHGNRLGATLRLDLPGPQVLAAPAGYSRTVRDYLAADTEADGSLLAFFTSKDGVSPDAQSVDLDYHPLLSGLDAVLEDAGMPIREAWFVGADYWRDAYCMDPSCCPAQGRPLQKVLDSTINAEMVYRGSTVGPAPGRPAAAAPSMPGLYHVAVQESEAAWTDVLDGHRDSRAQLRAVLMVWETLLCRPAGGPWLPDVERDGFLRATLLVPAWRDALMVMAAAGRHAAEAGADQFGLLREGGMPPVLPPPSAPASGDAGSSMPVSGPRGTGDDGQAAPGYGQVLMGAGPSVPEWPRLNALDLVLEQLALPGGPAAAAALTVRGWISWCRGRGSYAVAYLAEALAIEPGYRLAELLLEMVGRGVICGWAGRKEAAWQKF